ncbi:SpoIIE family protein phosphatase [Candidatus Poribacteria bacterium]|nr:SpoIIE family protein phosphatase [Candidatus Poribacteria bacterium]MYG05193.1 SpoIIE family protein phosphatase [Candidatus Poribacteria bacterium]MYK21628.1 SpoIIE family protein phosphatase [Candidatus Poribacteria bacterium]
MKYRLILISHLILAVFGFTFQAPAQESEPTPVTGIRVLTLDDIEKGGALLVNWKYHPGDDQEWANPAFDDTEWQSTESTELSLNEIPRSGWEGIGWFRLHLSVPDERLWHTPLALQVIYQAGASEIYLDGELIYTFGEVGNTKEEEEPYWERNPQVISFSGETDHLIAVRYSNFSSYHLTPVLGFALGIGPLNPGIKGRVNIVRSGTTVQMVWTAILIFMMLQHLLLFFFYPCARENLYFALSAGSIGVFVFLILQFFLVATSVAETLYLLRLLVCVYVLMFLSGMLFLYTIFYPKLPKLFWFFLAGWVLILCFGLRSLRTGFPLFGDGELQSTIEASGVVFASSFNIGLAIVCCFLFAILTFLEMARVIIVAIFKKKDGAWIFGLGSLMPIILPSVFAFFVSYTGFENININWQFSTLAITLAPLFSMSVYLARNFSRTHRKLETEVLERQLLEVENTRKTEELEKARELQLSMLPQAAPQLPNFDIAFEMRPATEVGGDYYDYNLNADGQLTLAIGDATGHGTNAGLVVSAVKSLFKTSAPDANNLETLERISQGIRSMNLKRLYMAMTLVTFNHNTLKLTGAGMPPPLIYRADENLVEEILLEGMPLGGFIGAQRQEASFDLQSGDTILLMSDGLPEMLNPENEMLDYPKTKELFEEVADQSPEAIIDHLFKASTSWADGEPQADDVTLVVIKVK